MHITCLHTSDVHVETFDHIFPDLDSELLVDHHVNADFLMKAQREGLEAVRGDVHDLLEEIAKADVVLCTCSTLGPLVDEVAQTLKNVLRVDRPLMAQACADGPKILVAMCLESTRNATLELLSDCAEKLGHEISPVVVHCDKAWSFFEAGDMVAYAASIARAVKLRVAEQADIDCIVLAQASMRVAEAELAHMGIPVHSSPVLAARRCIEIARKNARPMPAT